MIRIHDQPTLRGFLALNLYAAQRRLRPLLIIAALLMVVFVFSPMTASMRPDTHNALGLYRSNLGLLILPGLLVCILITTYFAAKRRWAAAKELREEREYAFDGRGVQVTAASFNGFLEWKLFTHAEVHGRYLFLRTAQNQFHFFPLSSVTQKGELFELLRQKVPGTKKLQAA